MNIGNSRDAKNAGTPVDPRISNNIGVSRANINGKISPTARLQATAEVAKDRRNTSKLRDGCNSRNAILETVGMSSAELLPCINMKELDIHATAERQQIRDTQRRDANNRRDTRESRGPCNRAPRTAGTPEKCRDH